MSEDDFKSFYDREIMNNIFEGLKRQIGALDEIQKKLSLNLLPYASADSDVWGTSIKVLPDSII